MDITCEFLYKLFLTVVGVALFSFIDKARWMVAIGSCLCGATAFVISEILSIRLGNGFITYYISATITCLLAEVGARVIRAPVTVILLPAIIPLVPGALLYSAMKAAMNGDPLWYSEYGAEATRATAGIGIAIVSVSAIARAVCGAIMRFLKHKK